MSETLERPSLLERVRVKACAEVAGFLWNKTGQVVESPSPQANPTRKLLKLDRPLVHPYGGVLVTVWVDASVLEVLQ